MVALEAMACARPVVVSDVGGLRGTVKPEVSGLRFPRGDAVALADQLLRLLDDAPLREWMGLAARARVEAEFGWDRIIERDYLPLLQRLA
jgi:glycosyltransferase involved in cell wall biosynthesis